MQSVAGTEAARGGVGGWVGSHRRPIAVTLVGIACLLTLVVSLSAWVDRQLLDTDTWVDQSRRMLADPEVRHAVALRMVDAVYEEGRVAARVEDRLPPQLAPLAPQIAAGLRPVAEDAAEAILERPAVQTLWEELNRRAHTRLVAVLEGGEGGAVTSAGGDVVLDLRPLVQRLREALGVEGGRLPEDAGAITIMHSDQLEAAQTAVRAIKAVSVVAAVAVAALLVAAVWVGAGSRREVVRAASWGLLIVGIVLLLVRRLAGDAVIDALADPQGEPAAREVWTLATSVLRDLGLGLVALGLVGLAWALLAGRTRLGVRLRRLVAPTLRERPALAFAAVLLVALLLLLWGPVGAPRQLVGTLFVLLVAVAGTEALRRQALAEGPASPEDPPAVERRRSPG